DEGAGEGQHLLLATRKLRAAIGLALAQRGEELEQPRQRPRPGGIAFRNPDVLDDGKIGKDQAALRYVGNARARNAVRWPARDRSASEHHRAPAWRHQPHDGLDGCGFADAVAPEHRSNASFRQIEIDALQDVAGTVVRIEAGEGEHYSIPPR